MDKQPVYKRILLKLSGEALAPEDRGNGILDFTFIERVAAVIRKCLDAGVQIGIIVGAGNIWRGAKGVHMDRCRADHMGMLGTVINALALQDTFLRCGIDTAVMTAVEMHSFADHYTSRDADKALSAGRVVIFGGGLGAPYFSTDTAAALRAAEIGADAILMAKNVDYLYDSDPRKNPDAKPIYDITYEEIIERDLRAFDMTAVSFCMDNHIDAYGFALKDPENIYRAVMGEPVGTKMHP
ncbi:uridylate kinase [Clostridium sp. CAG:448]|nr:uridylate kinase [Clostridium sp. CAG:448]